MADRLPEPEMACRARLAMLEQACELLAALVRQEQPEGLSLAEIAFRWAESPSEEQLEALAELERQEPN